MTSGHALGATARTRLLQRRVGQRRNSSQPLDDLDDLPHKPNREAAEECPHDDPSDSPADAPSTKRSSREPPVALDLTLNRVGVMVERPRRRLTNDGRSLIPLLRPFGLSMHRLANDFVTHPRGLASLNEILRSERNGEPRRVQSRVVPWARTVGMQTRQRCHASCVQTASTWSTAQQVVVACSGVSRHDLEAIA